MALTGLLLLLFSERSVFVGSVFCVVAVLFGLVALCWCVACVPLVVLLSVLLVFLRRYCFGSDEHSAVCPRDIVRTRARSFCFPLSQTHLLHLLLDITDIIPSKYEKFVIS